jgi:hypothetical protein
VTATSNKALFGANVTYAPADLRALLASTWAVQGIVRTTLGTFTTTQSGTPGMSVLVGGGMAVIEDSRGTQLTRMSLVTHTTTSNTLAITTADPSNPRIDLVILRVKQIEMGDASDVPGSLEVIAGTPAGSPSVPSTPSGAIAIAQVAVGAGVTSIVNANITDVRTYAQSLNGQPTAKILSGDLSVSAGSATDITGMVVNSLPAGTYEVNLSVYGITGSTAGSGMTIYVAASGGITKAAYHGFKDAGGSFARISGTATFTEGFTPGGSSQPFYYAARQIMVIGAGSVSLQASRTTSDGTVKATLTNFTIVQTQ